MGPYSESLQDKRRASLERIIATPNLGDDMRRIWKQHLNKLSVNEDEYNARVVQVYKNASKGGYYAFTAS